MRLDVSTRHGSFVRCAFFAAVVSMSLLAVGCADATPSSPEATKSVDGAGYELPEGPQPDPGMWNRPLGDGALEATSARIEALSFDPVMPEALGPAQAAFVDDPADFGPLASMGWSFRLADFPHLILVETPSGATEEQLMAPTTATPGCSQADAPPGDDGATVIACRGAGFSRLELKTTPARGVDGAEVVSITWLSPATGASKELLDLYAAPVIELTLMAPANEASSADLAGLAMTMGF